MTHYIHLKAGAHFQPVLHAITALLSVILAIPLWFPGDSGQRHPPAACDTCCNRTSQLKAEQQEPDATPTFALEQLTLKNPQHTPGRLSFQLAPPMHQQRDPLTVSALSKSGAVLLGL